MNTKRKATFHIVTAVLLVASVCFSVFRFDMVFGRIIEAGKDLGLSIAYYFLFMFEAESAITPTIGILPPNIETVLPITLEQLEELMNVYVSILFDAEYVGMYFEEVGDVLYVISQTLLMMILPTLALVLVLFFSYKTVDTRHNEDTKPLRFWKRVYRFAVSPIVFWIKKYIRFLRKRKPYRVALVLLWLYNLNLLTIGIEAVAWYFYFAVSWDVNALLVTIAKIVADFMVPVFFFPTWAWLIIGYKIFDWIRRRIGDMNIRAGIKKVVKFLKSFPGAKFINGKQRSKKTSLLTQLKTISEVEVMRPKALENARLREKQFPTFPWIVYDRFIVETRKKHRIYNWAKYHQFFNLLRWANEHDREWSDDVRKQVKRHLRRNWCYRFDDYCFGYRGKRVFDSALDLVTMYDALEAYGKQMFLYAQDSPLDSSNYPIRSDFEVVDEGNVPEFKCDLLEKDTRASFARSKYSHRLNWDSFRLGKQFNPNSPENNAVEFGIRCSMEHAKERKNQLTRRVSEKEEGAPTQDNDLVETETKVHTHVATVDNYTYWEEIDDDQRAGSLGSDNTDLMTKIYIRKAHEAKCYLPFFALDEALYMLVTAIFDKLYYFIRKKKGCNTALGALLWKLYTPIFRHYARLFNRYSYYPLELKVVDGSDDEVLADGEKLPLIALVAYRGRFRTDGLGEFYYQKNKHSPLGLDDIVTYQALTMTMDEMTGQNSYMIKDFLRNFTGGVPAGSAEANTHYQ